VAAFVGCGAQRLVLSASTSEAYGWLFKLLCDAADEVLVPAPCYPLLDYLAELEGVQLCRYPLRYDGRWCVDLPLVEGSHRTKALVAINPGNPTGTVLTPEEADGLARLCAERGWALILDEVFHDPARSSARRDWPCLTFVLGGLSKAAGLPQLKVAWTAVLGPGHAEALAQLAFIADTYLSVATPQQIALAGILERSGEFRRRVAERCAQNRAALCRLPPSWQLLEAEAGWSAIIRVPADVHEETRCLELLERGVVVHPGYFYDFPSGAHLVVSLLPEPAVFAEGVARL
jgi:alanine-synthesizing transaminase